MVDIARPAGGERTGRRPLPQPPSCTSNHAPSGLLAQAPNITPPQAFPGSKSHAEQGPNLRAPGLLTLSKAPKSPVPLPPTLSKLASLSDGETDEDDYIRPNPRIDLKNHTDQGFRAFNNDGSIDKDSDGYLIPLAIKSHNPPRPK